MDKSGRKTRPAPKPKRSRTPKGVARGTLIPTATGGYLVVGAGRGPKKGAPNAGRPRDEWVARLQALASRDDVLAHVEAVLVTGPTHEFFARALDYVTDHGYGRATQPVALSGAVALESLLLASQQPKSPAP